MDERQQFVAFVEARWVPLTRYAYLLTGQLSDAEDLVQAALVRCLPRWGRLDADGVEAYVRTVIARLAWQGRRGRSAREVVTERLPDVSVRQADLAGVAAVRVALSELPRDQRVVLVLRYWAGYSEREIADALGVRSGTVKSRASRALAQMRAALADDPPERVT